MEFTDTNYLSYPLPGFTMDAITIRMVLYLMISIIYVTLVYCAFKKHQVA